MDFVIFTFVAYNTCNIYKVKINGVNQSISMVIPDDMKFVSYYEVV